MPWETIIFYRYIRFDSRLGSPSRKRMSIKMMGAKCDQITIGLVAAQVLLPLSELKMPIDNTKNRKPISLVAIPRLSDQTEFR